LAAALRVRELLPTADCVLWEAAARLGGVLKTEYLDEYLLEHSADNFLAADQVAGPAAVRFAAKVGLGDELLPTLAAHRRAAVLYNGRPVPLPEGFVLMAPRAIWPILTTPLLSWHGKLRLLGELFVPARGGEVRDESLASFARRRFGDEVFERLIQPLIGGIYTADPEKLSLAATLPKYLDWERQCGSVLQGCWEEQTANREALHDPPQHDARGGKIARGINRAANNVNAIESGARYSQFLAPRLGMEQLVAAAARHLPAASIQLERAATKLASGSNGRGWLAWHDKSNAPESYDTVIVTLPAPRAAAILKESAPMIARELRDIEYAGSNVVILAYRRDQFALPPNGFGMVVPAIARRQILAVSYSSEKFPGRAPAGTLLLRVFVGGALQPELLKLNDAALLQLVQRELRSIYGVWGEPLLTRVARWEGAMPQYHLGHLDRVSRIEAAAAKLPGLELAGAAYRGVGIPQCIRGGEAAAERAAVKWLDCKE